MLRKSCRFFEIIDLRGWSKYCANTLREAMAFFNNGWMGEAAASPPIVIAVPRENCGVL
jgi:hypothetical protein